MLFMIIERFRDDDMVPIYRRLRERGRSLPEGLDYVDSWIEPNFARCFQLMRCDDLRKLQEWVLGWRGAGGDVRDRSSGAEQGYARGRCALSRSAFPSHHPHLASPIKGEE